MDDLELSKLVAKYSFGKLYVLRMISKSVDYYFYKQFIKKQTESIVPKEEEEKRRIVKLPSFAALRGQLLEVREPVGGLCFRRAKSENDFTELNSIESRSE